MFLSVIIPAYNEERRLPKTLEKVRDYLAKQKYDFEVLVVNDGSNDKTAEIISKLILSFNQALGMPLTSSHPSQPTRYFRIRPQANISAEFGALLDRRSARGIPSGFQKKSSFRLIDNKINRGKGAVVKQGILEAKGDWRLFMDADGSTDISELEKLFKFAVNSSQFTDKFNCERLAVNGKHYQIIIGSRYLNPDSIKIKQPLGRRIVSRLGNILTKLLLGLDLKDTQCGFKLFSREAAKKIFPLQTINRWGFDMEVLTIAQKKGFKIKEVAVDWRDAEGSLVKKGAALKTLRELMIIKWNMIKGRYK